MAHRDRSTTSQSKYGTAEWKRTRKLIVKRDPVCHWCKARPSTVADHLTHSADDARFFDLTNLVGSCWTCNSQRGARKLNQMKAERAAQTPTQQRQASTDRMLDDVFDRLKRGKQ